MDPVTLLMTVTLVGVVALFAALAFFVYRLVKVLGEVEGGVATLLAKIRMGVRAIEVQTGRLGPEVGTLNERLGQVGDGLETIDGNLAELMEAVVRQERR
ncbi:MAG: hypothetical protein R3304_08165 [Longimicrobiales bacterium]|nr:hypothetical protein [Longimicrobiales bacterium]